MGKFTAEEIQIAKAVDLVDLAEQIGIPLKRKRMFASIRVACIVNLSEIVQVVRDELLLKNGNTLHVGRAYRQEIKLRHLQFLKEQL